MILFFIKSSGSNDYRKLNHDTDIAISLSLDCHYIFSFGVSTLLNNIFMYHKFKLIVKLLKACMIFKVRRDFAMNWAPNQSLPIYSKNYYNQFEIYIYWRRCGYQIRIFHSHRHNFLQSFHQHFLTVGAVKNEITSTHRFLYIPAAHLTKIGRHSSISPFCASSRSQIQLLLLSNQNSNFGRGRTKWVNKKRENKH